MTAPGGAREPRASVLPAALHDFTVACLQTTGMPIRRARQVADVLVDADLAGVSTHGVTLLPRYVTLLEAGALNADPDIRVVGGKGAVRVMDGDAGMGHLVAAEGMRLAMDVAGDHGVGVVAVRRSDHFGHAGFYAGLAPEQGMIGHVVTNTPAVMAAWGGAEPVIGNNPLAYGIPAGSHPPIVFDMACSMVAKGRVRIAADQGGAIPQGWALDAHGNATTDARAALAGAVLPVGEHKGYGLAVVGEILAGLLPGALFGLGIPRGLAMGRAELEPWGVGHWLAAVDVEAFRPLAEFLADVERLVRDLKASAAEGNEVLLPGELEHRRRAEGRVDGIRLTSAVVRQLDDLARRLSLDGISETPFD